MQHVETRHRSGLETILLIFELTLQQVNRFLLHADKRLVDDHLIKLRLHRGNELIEHVAKREVGAVALKKSAADRRQRRAVKDQLRARNANIVGYITLLRSGDAWRWCWRSQ